MRKYTLILLAFIGLISLFSSCEKDETKATMLATPIAPTLTTVPTLVLKRAEATKILQFVGTKADFGFQSSVTYNLEADVAGNQFKSPISIASYKADTFNISVTSLNSILIATLPLDQTTAMELRVRAVLTLEASGAKPIVATSPVKAVSITTYGPPALAFTTAGTAQTITSPNDNKLYSGFIYTDGTAFQFTNKDDGKIYGGTGGVLTENGPAISLPTGGYSFTADINTGAMKYSSSEVTVCMIGDATPGGWGADTKMIWNFTDHSWNLHTVIVAGGCKFRTFGGWGHVNAAYRPGAKDLNNLYQSHGALDGTTIESDLGDSANIDDIAPGTYDVKLFLETKPWRAVFTPAK
jgi:hypothetical protein